MKTGLNVGERIQLLSILPKEGSFVTLKMIRSMSEALGATETEIKEFEIVEENGYTRWNTKGLVPKDFTFTDAEVELIRKQFKRLDAEQKIPVAMMSLYEKFVG